jgi:hypothetical protein
MANRMSYTPGFEETPRVLKSLEIQAQAKYTFLQGPRQDFDLWVGWRRNKLSSYRTFSTLGRSFPTISLTHDGGGGVALFWWSARV